MVAITTAIHERNFQAFGQAVEKNALMMHATMLTSTPPVCYWLEETVASMNVIFQARKRGVEVYFTMDAGPNIKLLFLKHDAQSVLELFPKARLVDLLP
jgi:diphosphomevalonate decarboxylase